MRPYQRCRRPTGPGAWGFLWTGGRRGGGARGRAARARGPVPARAKAVRGHWVVGWSVAGVAGAGEGTRGPWPSLGPRLSGRPSRPAPTPDPRPPTSPAPADDWKETTKRVRPRSSSRARVRRRPTYISNQTTLSITRYYHARTIPDLKKEVEERLVADDGTAPLPHPDPTRPDRPGPSEGTRAKAAPRRPLPTMTAAVAADPSA